MRPIDADALQTALVDEYNGISGCKTREKFYRAIEIVRRQPTIAPPPNNPLTLEELREMDGEPVFIKCLFNDELSSYVVVDKRRDSAGIFTRLFYASFDYYGDEWLPYRRKPEEG